MPYRVVSRFFDRASGRYFDPGQECPLLPAEDAARLLRARCLEVVPAGAGPRPADAPAAPAAPAAAPPPSAPAAPPPTRRAPRAAASSLKERGAAAPE